MKEDDTLLPEKWRNKLFKFQAGGYDGCIEHPAALIVTGDGRVRLIGSDGGAGGLDAEDWYSRVMRDWYDAHGIDTEGDLLYGPKKNDALYKELLSYRRERREERHRRERLNVRVALEAEIEHGNLTGMRWDHEFQEYDISTPDKVRETCKAMCHAFYDQCFPAKIADVLRDEGYEGAGVVCSDCGEYFEDTDYESFSDCIDNDAYHGIGGLAVAYTRILCTDCRQACECPCCCGLTLPTSAEQKAGTDTDHMTYKTEFFYRLMSVCEYCSDNFVREHDEAFEDPANGLPRSSRPSKMERLDFRIEPVLDELEAASDEGADTLDPAFAEECRKYAAVKRDEGWTEEAVRKAISDMIFKDAEDKLRKVPKKFREGLFRNMVGAIASDFFMDCNSPDEEDLDEFWNELTKEKKE